MNGDNDNDNDIDGAANLDHTLLESLFYNEMMLLDESSFLSPDFMGSLTAETDGGGINASTNRNINRNTNGTMNINVLAEKDASALAERDLLQHFGVPSRSFGESLISPPLIPSSKNDGVVGMWTPSGKIPETSRIPHERAQHLVSQFATLASRLGISLPQSVLSSLTQQVQAKEAGKVKGESPSHNTTIGAHSFDGSSSVETSPNTAAPMTQLQDTSDAICVVAPAETRKRSHSDPLENSKAPLYSKRRKKPRLSDCETKLASLKSENEMLKRHLDTIANKSQKFDQDRKEAEWNMKRLIQEGAGPEQINPLLSKFSQMYSDYGSHRHQELTFHLEQLERLAAPTNFTKMGLWTLGQNEGFYTDLKRNPIASILSKELSITPQQGRKILEQRQKIQDLSANLKECLGLLANLKELCEHKQKVFHDRMSKCQEILTPLQVVKLLLWVDEHSNILETVCPGWGSERIQPTKDKGKE